MILVFFFATMGVDMKSLSSNWYVNLINQIYNGTLDDVLSIAEDVLDNPLFIRDNNHAIIAISRTRYPEVHFYTYLQENLVFPPDTIQGLVKNKRIYSLDDFTGVPVLINFDSSKPDLLTLPIFVDKVAVAYVSIVQITHPFTDGDYENFKLIGKAVSSVFNRDDMFRKNLGMTYETFLSGVIEKDFPDERSRGIINRRMESLGISLKPNLFLGVITESGDTPVDINKLRMHARDLGGILHEAIFCTKSGRLVFLSSSQSDELLSEEEENNLNLYLSKYGMSCIISSPFSDIAYASRNLRHIERSLEIGCSLYPKRRLHYSDDLLFYQILDIATETSGTFIPFVSTKLIELRDYDRKKGSGLLTTLYYYITLHQDTNKIAAKLNIHKNTLFYRITRIREITGFDLNDAETVFKIMLSFKIFEYSTLESGRTVCFKAEEDLGR